MVKKGFFYGNMPDIFGWSGFFIQHMLILGLLILNGYGVISVKMSVVSYFFVKLFLGYLIIFRLLRYRYEKIYGKFKSEYSQDIVFQLPYMQFLYCLNEYATLALMASLFWMFVSGTW